MTHAQLDLSAYFERIGYDGPLAPSLATLNGIIAAHTQCIPFENLDVLLGREIALDNASLRKKLIENNRGGYCFEQNGLLISVLEILGFEVAPISARVRIGSERDHIPPRTHLFARVEIEGTSWFADVGVGGLTPTSAIRFTLDVTQSSSHEPRRIVREGDLYFHQVLLEDGWKDICDFTLEQMPLIDREVANWYTSTHPESHFRDRLLVARATPEDGRVTIQNDIFNMRNAAGVANKQKITSKEDRLQILARHFGLRFDMDIPLAFPNLSW